MANYVSNETEEGAVNGALLVDGEADTEEQEVDILQQIADAKQAQMDKIEAAIKQLLDGIVDLGIPPKQAPAYLITAFAIGDLDKLIEKLGIAPELLPDIAAFLKDLTGIFGKAVNAVWNMDWETAVPLAIIALNSIKWFGNLIFGGPSDAYEAFLAETGQKKQFAAWRQDAKKRNFWERLEKWTTGRFGPAAGAVARKAGPIGLILSILYHADKIEGASAAIEDKVRSLIGLSERKSLKSLKLDVGTPMYDRWGNEYHVIEGDKVKQVSNDKEWDFFVNQRSGQYYLRGTGGIEYDLFQDKNEVGEYAPTDHDATTARGYKGGGLIYRKGGGDISDKVSLIYKEGYTAPGQAYAIAKSKGYKRGGLIYRK